jgi:putative nucleotidyltransferase with HDIG domain
VSDDIGEKAAGLVAARQVELAVTGLPSLSTLPCIAIQYLPKLSQGHFSPSSVADIVESDPALASRVFSLSYQHGIDLPNLNFSLRLALDRLPSHLVRDAILSVGVYAESGDESPTTLRREELIVHSLAVACCAKNIAGLSSLRISAELAYFAGLLHDIGKLALQEVMPKSLSRIVEDAKSTKAGSQSMELKHLGTDHTLLGKALAQRWHLPDAVGLAVWLHHSDTAAIAQRLPEARIAQVVQLADAIARQLGVGRSGSHDEPQLPEKSAQMLGISTEQIEQIRRKLPDQVREKSNVLGLALPHAWSRYCKFVHSAAVQFARQQTDLSLENRRLQNIANDLDFFRDFLLGVDPSVGAIETAETFAVRWQRFYQTGMVCLYLVPYEPSPILEAAIVESLGQSRTVVLDVPEGSPPIPQEITNQFRILNAHEYVAWLLDELELELDQRQTKLIPLLSGGKAVGAMVFELRYPADVRLLEEKFGLTASIGAAILDRAIALRRQQRFGECFSQMIAASSNSKDSPGIDRSLDALVEVAAGVAHELNNPLSVISGRAQLLAQPEAEDDRSQSLQQIQENARKVSAIIEDLMSFAEPQSPRPMQTDIKQMLDEALQLTAQKANVDSVDAEIQLDESANTVFVDSAQIVSSVANILCNCLESYADKSGPIQITVNGAGGDLVRFQIRDQGRGMDARSLERATYPFFSAKPAGRGRGMGLTYAARLIELNRGSLTIDSRPGGGTTVTLYLPSR